MKDEIVALAIAIIFAVLFAYNSHAMEAKTQRITGLIDRVEKSGDTDSKSIKKIRSVWEKDMKTLMLMTSHENILKVDECMEMAEEWADEKRWDVCMYLLIKARHHLRDLREREKIKLDNIF